MRVPLESWSPLPGERRGSGDCRGKVLSPAPAVTRPCQLWQLELAALAAPLLTARQMGWGSWAPGVQGDQKQAPTEVLFLATWLVVSLFKFPLSIDPP